jgi:hypothetical protein
VDRARSPQAAATIAAGPAPVEAVGYGHGV